MGLEYIPKLATQIGPDACFLNGCFGESGHFASD